MRTSSGVVHAAARGTVIGLAGGLFLAIEFAEAWRGGEPAKLRFF